MLTWVFLFLIGLLTGLVAFAVALGVSGIFMARASVVFWMVGEPESTRISALYVLFNLACAVAAGSLVLLVSEAAAGSGIPNVYAYLNGVDVPDFLTLRTAIAKIPGSILTVAGGLAIGKEGPLLHIGSIIAHFLGQTSLFRRLKQAKEKEPFMADLKMRDLVACGAAAGLAAGFKAPIGGVLFALEMSTRWRTELTWRCLFACAVTAWVVRSLTALCKTFGHCGFLNWGSLLFFKVTFDTPYSQLPMVVVLGICGGFLGCMFTTINTYIGSRRSRFRHNRWLRIQEVAVISIVTSTLALTLPSMGTCINNQAGCTSGDMGQCFPGSERLDKFSMYQCQKGEYNDLAVLIFSSQGYTLRSLLASQKETLTALSTLAFTAFYFSLSCVTYGAALPAGLLTPSLLFGASFGRLFAHILSYSGLVANVDFGLYAFLGAAAVLGGMFRFAVSFCVILLELLNTEMQLPLLMLTLVFAKGIGDRFNQPILYHLCMVMGFPHVGTHPESTIRRKGFLAKDVMDSRPRSFAPVEDPAFVKHVLACEVGGAFPVVKRHDQPCCHATEFLGMVEARDVLQLLDAQEEDAITVDLTPIVKPPPIIIPPSMPLTTVFKLYNTTGVKYLPVLETRGTLRGLISRKELVDCERLLEPDTLQSRVDEQCRRSFTGGRQSLSGTPVLSELRVDQTNTLSSPLLGTPRIRISSDQNHDGGKNTGQYAAPGVC